MKPRCPHTGRIINGSADGVYDDGEWISWDWINQQLEEQEEKNAKFYTDTQDYSMIL